MLTIIVIDTETGGLDATRCALLSVAAVAMRQPGEITARFHSYVNPPKGLDLDPAAYAVNGLTQRPDWPSEAFVMAELQTCVGECSPSIIAGCNTAFDAAFINAACHRSHMRDLIQRGTLDLASLALAAHLKGTISLPLKYGSPSTSLDSILGALGMARPDGMHSALADATLTALDIAALLWRK